MKSVSIAWQPVRALPMLYEIESDSLVVIEAARSLFAPWLVAPETMFDLTDIAQTWRINVIGATESVWSINLCGHENGRVDSLIYALAHIEYAALRHTLSHLPPTFIGFHGALLSCEMGGRTRGVLVVGPKEAGKSTLSCAMWRAGWQLHCDDFSLLDESARAHPTARRVSLREGSHNLLGDFWERAQRTPNARPSSMGLAFHPHELPGAPPVRKEPIELSALIFLNRRDSHVGPAQTKKLEGIEAAFALLPYSTLFSDKIGIQLPHERADWGLKLAQLATRVKSLPFYDLGRGAPQDMISALESLIKTTN